MNIYWAGIIGGLFAGFIFGLMMWKMGKLPMIAKLWGGSTVGFGWLVHLVNSAVIGLLYVWLVPLLGITLGIWSGLIYGFVWWILGPWLIMPIWLKTERKMPIKGLLGHLIYGLVLGWAVIWLI